MNVDLARRVRDYARDPGRAAVNVSSAWLAREFAVDPRTVAAALRPHGIRPASDLTMMTGRPISAGCGPRSICPNVQQDPGSRLMPQSSVTSSARRRMRSSRMR